MSKEHGLCKYPKTIPAKELEDEGLFFMCPRKISLSDGEPSSLDIAVLVLILSYTGILYNNKLETPLLSVELLSEILARSKTKKNKDSIQQSLSRLNTGDIVDIKHISDNLFKASIDVSEGYFKYYYNDLDKLLELDTPLNIHRCIHVSYIEFSNLYGVRGGHDSYEKFVTYRSHSSLGELCGLSRCMISRAVSILEQTNIIASYNVIMKGSGAPKKSIRARYSHRDILRKYVEKGIGDIYADVFSKEIKDE